MILKYMKNQQVTLKEGLPWGWANVKRGEMSRIFSSVFS
jgi:hypothetical protein